LPVWFRRYGVRHFAAARPVVERYLGYYSGVQVHRELGCPPLTKFAALADKSRFTKPSPETNLDHVFAHRYWRKVDRANTVRYDGAEYQLEPDRLGHSYCGRTAEVRAPGEGRLRIYVNGREVRCRKLLTLAAPKPICHLRQH
jgi:hypothetical protein